jgi:uncharacterized protein YggU (UPF0235/DUF167 family)
MYIKAKVTAGAKKEEFQEMSSDTFIIKVKEKAQKNMANKKVLEMLRVHFKVPLKNIRIINGHHSPSKLISINTK